MANHASVGTDSGYRELQATMDENERMRIRAMRRCGPWRLERLPGRVAQTISSSADEPKSQPLPSSSAQLPTSGYRL